MIAYLQHANSVTVILKGNSYNISEAHPKYAKVMEALQTEGMTESKLLKIISTKNAINIYGKGLFKIVDNHLEDSKGNILHGSLVERILKLHADGKPVKFLCRFLENLYKNPARHAIDELYLFLERNDLPITDDGCFVAYKGVDDDYSDLYSHKYKNTVGAVMEMPRHDVDDNRENTCSVGFHVGRFEYANDYAGARGRLMICKVNPADVVSVPPDYDCSKLRTCRYEVIGEVTDEEDRDVLNAMTVYQQPTMLRRG